MSACHIAPAIPDMNGVRTPDVLIDVTIPTRPIPTGLDIVNDSALPD